MSTDLSYELSAQYYDSVYAAQPFLGPDATFYEDLAIECGGSILELGCGTGRVLLPIAQRGLSCAGVDKSPAMLEQFRQKPGAEGVVLVRAEMESFDLEGRRFDLVFSAFRAFQHLETVDQQLNSLSRVRAHLAPGGVFAFDVFNPRIEMIALDEEPEALDVEFTHQGKAMQRYFKVIRDRAHQLIKVTMRYAGDGPDTTVTFTMRWFWRYELEHLLHRAGCMRPTRCLAKAS